MCLIQRYVAQNYADEVPIKVAGKSVAWEVISVAQTKAAVFEVFSSRFTAFEYCLNTIRTLF